LGFADVGGRPLDVAFLDRNKFDGIGKLPSASKVTEWRFDCFCSFCWWLQWLP